MPAYGQHARSSSNSFRINLARSASPPPPSPASPTGSSSDTGTSGHYGRVRQTRRRTKSLHGDASVRAWTVGVRSWLGTRVSSSSRSSPRRWTVLVSVLGFVCLYQVVVTGSEDRSAVGRTGGWLRYRGQYVDDGLVPVVDRAALDKLRLLEVHLGLEDENDVGDQDEALPDEDSTSTAAAVKFPKPPPAPQDLDAPPLVAEIPNVLKPDPLAPIVVGKVPAEILDAQVCPEREGQPCAFLVPAWLGEQETKAQQHLHQLGMLALALNRTLVLPNVSKSRLGTCYANPFSFYYDPDSLDNLGIPTITQAEFASWSVQRDPPPSAQVVTMTTAQKAYTTGAVEIDSAADPWLVPNKPTRNLCLRAPRTRLDFSDYSPLAIFPPEGYHRNEASRFAFGESTINTLKSQAIALKSSRVLGDVRAEVSIPNVYAFNYELRFPMMAPSIVEAVNPSIIDPPLPFAHFPYASTWTEIAELVVENLSPFIAIHWRTETLTPSNLAPCAQSLIRKLVQLKQRYPEITNVYLATDYPLESLQQQQQQGGDADSSSTVVAHSGTFAKVVTEQHHAAFRRFLRDFERQAKGLRLTTFAQEQNQIELTSDLRDRLGLGPSRDRKGDQAATEDNETMDMGLGLENLDSGLYGILDKEITTRAEVFLTGVPGVGSSTVDACAKLSSFTNQLVEARQARFDRLGQGFGHGDDVDGNEQGGAESKGEGEGEETQRVNGRLWNVVSHWALKGTTDD